jgi:hypothetical protein
MPHPSLPLPGLRLPLGRRRLAPGAAVSLLAHVAVIALLVIRGRELLERATPGAPGERGGGGGRVNFFALPAAPAPAAIPVPAAPAVTALPAPDPQALRHIHMDLPPLELPRPVTPPTVAAGGGGAGGGGGGGGPGTGGGQGAGVGVDVGPGTGDEGGYIVRAEPRRVIPWPPKCVRPGPVEVRFWVGADGRPTRVELAPAPPDARCRQEFEDLMMGTSFYPARRFGQPVPSVYSIRYSRGN